MRKIILPVCLLLCSFITKAQESKWGVSFTPAIVQSPAFHYGIQPGVEYRINHHFSLLTEIAFTTGKDKDLSYQNTRYFRIKPELRYVISAAKRRVKMYTGFQMSYSYRKWDNLSGGYYFDSQVYSDSAISYNKASITSPILTSSLQYGILLPIGQHFRIDIFTGMGARMIFTNYSGVENATKQPYMTPICRIVPAPDPAYWVNETVTRFHCNFGFRLLYRF